MSAARKLAFAAAVLVALALGLRWHLARGAEALMTELARAAAPVGALSWRATRVGLDGRIGATELVFESAGRRLTADALTLDLGGPLALLRRSLPGAPQDLPPVLRVELARLELPALAADADAPAGPALGLESLDVMPCGGADGAAVLRAVHGARLATDLAFGWRFEPERHRLALDAALGARGLVRVELDLELEALEPVARIEDLVRARPVARRGALTVVEQGWYVASAAHCAERSGLALADWLAANQVGAQELLAASGLAPSPGLLEGWRAFRAAPERLRFSFDNAALHGAEALLARGPDEIAALLGFAVEVNGKPVVDPGFTMTGAQRLLAAPPLADAPATAGAESLLGAEVRPLVTPVPASPPAEPVRAAPRAARPPAPASRDALNYAPPPGTTALIPSNRPPSGGTPLRWEALRDARGTAVAVVMKDGRTLRGVVRNATPWQLSLEQRIKGGSAVLPIERDAVARVVIER